MQKPLTAIIVGFGHRSEIYGDYSLKCPHRLKIIGVADPDRERCLAAAKKYGFSEDMCFSSARELAQRGRLADSIINGTMDSQHFETSAPLLELGYDMLLEKPFAVSIEEMNALTDIIKKHGNKVMICHVLRYAPFYTEIKKRIVSGELGEIINIQTVENVSYHHLTNSYVRGKWANFEDCKTGMLLAKSCHDIDIMMWLMQPTQPVSVSSQGGLMQFKRENAPENAGNYCTLDCPVEKDCLHSARKIYLDHPEWWACYVWAEFEHKDGITQEDRINSFKNGNPYNRCVYKCNNNVVDHQSVLVSFENGATGTHNMIGGTAKSLRKIHITGTKGEICGVLDEGKFTFSKINPCTETGFEEEIIDLSSYETNSHGGGDEALISDFVDYVQTGRESLSCTAIENSVAGHMTVFLAEKSREQNGAVLRFAENREQCGAKLRK